MPRPIFVGGSIRAGTTLLQSVLCASPDTHKLIHEATYLRDQMRLYHLWRRDRSPLVTHYFGSNESFREFTRRVIGDLLSCAAKTTKAKEAIVLKEPRLSFFFPDLGELLPEALFVLSVRDPRDTIASMLEVAARQEKGEMSSETRQFGRDLRKYCEFYKNFYLPSLRAMQDDLYGMKRRTMFVRYEDLVADPRAVAKRLAAFCRVALDDYAPDAQWSMADDYASSVAADNPFRTELYGKEVSAASIGRHRTTLSADERAAIDREFGSVYKLFNYA